MVLTVADPLTKLLGRAETVSLDPRAPLVCWRALRRTLQQTMERLTTNKSLA